MKFWKIFPFAVLFAAVMDVAHPMAMSAQTADIPINPGLWETNVSVNGAGPVHAQVCFTAGTKLGDYITASNRGATGAQCSATSTSQGGHGLSFDTVCKSAQFSSKGHITLQAVEAGQFSGTSQTVVTDGKSINMTINKTFSGKFVNSACGSVKPMVAPGR
jgi:hypothetical protein